MRVTRRVLECPDTASSFPLLGLQSLFRPTLPTLRKPKTSTVRATSIHIKEAQNVARQPLLNSNGACLSAGIVL